jgi:hypothetical protein
MSTISLRLPESLHKQARELAEKEGISINQTDRDVARRKDVRAHDARVSRSAREARLPQGVSKCVEEGEGSRANTW